MAISYPLFILSEHWGTVHLASIVFCTSLLGETYVSILGGDWNDSATWDGAEIPSTEDTFAIGDGAEVILTDSVTVASGGAWHQTANETFLKIEGADASLSVTGEMQLWSGMRMQISVLDGATVDFANLSWGSGGYNNVYVENSTFSAYFSQMKGSATEEGAKLTITGENARAYSRGGPWNIGSDSANDKFTLSVENKAVLNMHSNGSGRYIRVQASGAGASAELKATNGATIQNIWELHIAQNDGASNKVTIYGNGTSVTSLRQIYVGLNSTGASTSEASINLGGFDENGKFVAADANSLISLGTEQIGIKLYEGGVINYNLGDSNFEKANSASEVSKEAIIVANTFNAPDGTINLNLENITDLESGYYFVNLISSNSNLLSDTFAIEDWNKHILATDGNIASFDKIYIEQVGTTYNLLAGVNIIPEPSTYGLVFSILAFLGVCVLKRKNEK